MRLHTRGAACDNPLSAPFPIGLQLTEQERDTIRAFTVDL